MKALFSGLALLGLLLPGCGHKTPPKEPDPNRGKHKLAASDPRSWETYPVVALVAMKHRVGIDTVAQLLRSFEGRFGGDAEGPTFEAQLPTTYTKYYEEDAAPTADDVKYFAAEAAKYGLYPSAVADIISDFYLIGGSNRDFPEKSEN